MIRLLLVLSLAAGAYLFFTRGGCGTSGAIACADPALDEGVGVALQASEICPQAGYLCAGRGGAFQLVRWPLDKGMLRVRVGLPDFVDKDTARELRQAAIEGIREWHGHPFPIAIDSGSFTLRISDIVVVWSQGQGGHATVRTDVKGKRLTFNIEGVRISVPPTEALGTALLAQVKAIAMHEMGHALGLMHSDQRGDIMFFEYKAGVTAARASARDFRTVDALYSFPNGAMVQ
jgi:hypothetical protein